MSIRFAFLLLLVSWISVLPAQHNSNLIPNPSFEDVNICTKYQEACYPEAWRSSTLKAFYYLNDEHARKADNKAYDGHRYVSICMHNAKRAFDRGFLQTPLLCVLEAGKPYELSFYYKTPFNMLENFGVCFMDTLIIKKNNAHIQSYQADLNFKSDQLIPVNTWLMVRDTFIARGNEKVLLIGNFHSDERTNIIPLEKRKKRSYNSQQNRTYYHFDQFNLRAIQAIPSCDIEENKARIYADNIRHTIPKKKVETEVQAEEVKKEERIKEPEFLVIDEDSILISETFELPNILFETNSDQLLHVAYPSLRKLSNYLLRNRKQTIHIIGHTDNVGSEQANLLLSEKRAKAVRNYLLNQGIATNRIQYEGKGESMPIHTNDTDAGRSQNRRVEFRLENQ